MGRGWCSPVRVRGSNLKLEGSWRVVILRLRICTRALTQLPVLTLGALFEANRFSRFVPSLGSFSRLFSRRLFFGRQGQPGSPDRRGFNMQPATLRVEIQDQTKTSRLRNFHPPWHNPRHAVRRRPDLQVEGRTESAKPSDCSASNPSGQEDEQPGRWCLRVLWFGVSRSGCGPLFFCSVRVGAVRR
jgi:hypothetical protein